MSRSKSVFVHPNALVESDDIGEGTRVWAFAHVLAGAQIGRDANICDHVFVEGGVTLGNRVTVKSGVQLWDGLHAEDDVFIGPNASFTNDNFPRSKQRPERFEQTILRRNSSIGAGATVLGGTTVGIHAMVGAGAVVTRDVPPFAIAVGNPARITGYAATAAGDDITPSEPVGHVDAGEVGVGGVRVIELPQVRDLRGLLSFGEVETHLPFAPKRVFCISQVPSIEVRGAHAHRTLEQLLVCLSGRCSVVVDDGRSRAEVVLDSPGRALYLPPLVWGIQYKYSADAVLMVLASEKYNPDDYIRNYDEFQALVGGS